MKLLSGVLAALALIAAPAAHAAARPDLRVAALSPAAVTAAPGASAPLTFTVANRGRVAARRSTLRLLLSADAKRDRTDRVLARANVRALKAGKRAKLRATVTLPATPGAYRVLACADDLRKVHETREGNNCRSASVTLVAAAAAAVAPEVAVVPQSAPAPKPAATPTPTPAPKQCAATDVPDLAHVDADCDGIDGTAAASIFVAPTGDDAAPGTKAAPKRTLAAAVAAAQQAGRDAVLVAAGTYAERLVVADGVSVYGGYDAKSWQRRDTNLTWIQGAKLPSGSEGARAEGIGTPTTLQRLRISAPDAATGSAYGLVAIEATRLRLERVDVSAGAGANGAPGAAGSQGSNGKPGANGKAGDCDDNNPGAGGAGGGTLSVAYGGAGGAGGYGSISPTGWAGLTGWIGVAGGAGGATGNPGKAGQPGQNGPNGATGAPGMGGAGGAIVGGAWRSADGSEGEAGGPGHGGGGGGGGGGQDVWPFYGGGNGGGGGGEGGHGGRGGSGGKGGGGSFGVFAVGSHGLVITDSTVRSGAGGHGGTGGQGGNGGAGGAGGQGGKACVSEVGAGGAGGKGGTGGKGGQGGGGAGGPSYALFGTSGQLTVTDTILEHGTGGLGGSYGGFPGTGADRYGV